MKLIVLQGRFAIARLQPDEAIPSWAQSGGVCSITRTAAELSIVCAETHVPSDVRAERGWRCLELVGPIPFEMTGVVSSLTAPLAEDKISVFILSTFDTDYILVKERALDLAIDSLRRAGFEVG